MGRAVVFGGGTPTGSFGSALVFTAPGSLSLADAPTNPEQVVLDSAAGGARAVILFHDGEQGSDER